MTDILPLEADQLGRLADFALGTSVLLDGYRDSATTLALAGVAATLTTTTPHARSMRSGQDDLTSYVWNAVVHRGLSAGVVMMCNDADMLYEHAIERTFGLVVIDPDPEAWPGSHRIQRALRLADTVVVIERFALNPFEILTLPGDPNRITIDRDQRPFIIVKRTYVPLESTSV